MKVTILGNNSALPAFGRHTTAQAVTVFGVVILIDCGEGTQSQLQRYGIRWKNIQHIFISHLHGDHYFGLPGLLNSMSLQNRVSPLHIYAPQPLERLLNDIFEIAETVLTYPLHFHPLPEGDQLLIDDANFSMSCFPVEHRIKCHGLLVEKKSRGRRILPEKCKEYNIPSEFYESLKQGHDYTDEGANIVKNEWLTEDAPPNKRYAYCADTLFTTSYLPFIKGVDLMYHESTYLDEERTKAVARFHTTSKQAAELARLAEVKQLLLGHFSSKYKELEPFLEEAKTIFQEVMISVEGMVYDV